VAAIDRDAAQSQVITKDQREGVQLCVEYLDQGCCRGAASCRSGARDRLARHHQADQKQGPDLARYGRARRLGFQEAGRQEPFGKGPADM
jgi:hypothetical protein